MSWQDEPRADAEPTSASSPLSEPHRRFNPLTGDWVLVSADRTDRPWQGDQGTTVEATGSAYDPACYLCPGNARAGGAVNPPYTGTHAFTNDFPALEPGTGTGRFEDGLLVAEGERGTCRVICFSPRHDRSLGDLGPSAVREVIDLWADHTMELGAAYRWVQVFENRGAAMGASNPHPHGQIWAGSALPREAARESAAQQEHLERTSRRLLLDYVGQEAGGPRVVVEDEDWLIVVPFWAAWPFETLILPKRPAARLADLPSGSRDHLATALIAMLTTYDGLFERPMPYSMGWHQAPFGDEPIAGWQLHGHVYPPLLRSATVRKFMVGYELLSEPQRDLTPEIAAQRLRAVAAQRSR